MYSLTSMSKESRLAACSDEFSPETSLPQLGCYKFNSHLVPYSQQCWPDYSKGLLHTIPEFLGKVCIPMAPHPIFCKSIRIAYFPTYLHPLMNYYVLISSSTRSKHIKKILVKVLSGSKLCQFLLGKDCSIIICRKSPPL